MSERLAGMDGTLQRTLETVGARVRLQHAIEIGLLALSTLLAIGTVMVVLGAILSGTPLARWPLYGGLFLIVGALFLFGCAALRSVSLEEAAGIADDAAQLRDELKSTLWFSRSGDTSPWVAALLHRCSATVRGLDAGKLVPLRLPSTLWAVVILGAVLAAAVMLSPHFASHASDRPESSSAVRPARPPAAPPPGQAVIEEALASADAAAKERLERTLAALQDPQRSAEEKRRAVDEARQIAGQRALEAAASREQMRSLAESLEDRKGFEEVAQALRSGDAKAAADLLRQRMPSQDPAEASGGEKGGSAAAAAAPDQAAMDQLKESMESLSRNDGSQAETEGRLSKAVQNLEEISRRLDAAAALNRAARKLAAVSTALKRETTLRAARFGRQQGQGNPSESAETGDAEMKGGSMFRLGALAQEKPKAPGQESSRSGEASGHAPGDPVVGDEATRIQAKFKRETVKGQEADGNEGTDSAFYAASRQADARVEYQAVERRYRLVGEEALSPERIALRHRNQVKGFFPENAENAK